MKIQHSDSNFEILGNKSNLLNSSHDKYNKLRQTGENQGIEKTLFIR